MTLLTGPSTSAVMYVPIGVCVRGVCVVCAWCVRAGARYIDTQKAREGTSVQSNRSGGSDALPNLGTGCYWCHMSSPG